jgi:hypothetical protein
VVYLEEFAELDGRERKGLTKSGKITGTLR